MYSKQRVLCFIALNSLLAASNAAPAPDDDTPVHSVQNMKGALLEPEFLNPKFEDPRDNKMQVEPVFHVLPIKEDADQVPKREDSSQQAGVPQTLIHKISPLVGADKDIAQEPKREDAVPYKQVAQNLMGSYEKPVLQKLENTEDKPQPDNKAPSTHERPVKKQVAENNANNAGPTDTNSKRKKAKNSNAPGKKNNLEQNLQNVKVQASGQTKKKAQLAKNGKPAAKTFKKKTAIRRENHGDKNASG